MSEAGNSGQAQQERFELRSVTQAIPFPAGVYRLLVRSASPVPDPKTAHIPLPALLVAAAPGSPAGIVEFAGNPALQSVWLFNSGDATVVRVGARGAVLIFSSLRTEGTQTLDVKVDRVDVAARTAKADAGRTPSLKMQLDLHMRGEGDLHFVNAEWAGRIGVGSWIEALSISPLEAIGPADIEYKGLSANGFETPWLSDGAFCGTRGANTPLVGFAVRLKAQAAASYDCEYSARFRSGVVMGPLRNGAPCRSRTAGDPLEAVQVRVIKRAGLAAAPAAASSAASKATGEARKTVKGPRFSKFREDEAPVEVVVKPKSAVAKPAPKAATKSKAITSLKPASKSAKPKTGKTATKRK